MTNFSFIIVNMTERTGFIEVIELNNVVFTDGQIEDMVIYTETNTQSILLGTLQSNVSTLALRSNVATFNSRIGVSTSNPTESLDLAIGNAKFSSNVYAMQRIGIASSNPTETLDVASGNAKFTSNAYILQRIGITTSNPSESLDLAIGNAKFSSNVYAMQRMGIATSNPTETLDVVSGNAKFTSNAYILQRIGITTSNPSESLDLAIGNAKFSSNAYILQRLGISTSNPTETLDVASGNAKFTSNAYILQRIGITTSNPSESLDLAIGNAKFTSNVYAMQRIGIATSNPSESLDLTNGNAKISSNIYAGSRLGVGTSNPVETLSVVGNMSLSNFGKTVFTTSNNYLGIGQTNPGYTLDVNGNINFSGLVYQNGIIYPASRWSSNNTGSNIYYTAGRISIGSTNFDELFTLTNGNAKFSSNVYISNNVGIGTSNLSETLAIVGNMSLSNFGKVILSTSNSFFGISKSNPAYTLDVNGDINFTGTLYQNSQLFIGSRWSSNNTGSNIFFTNGRVNIGSNTFEELFNVTNGNVKFSSNLYVLNAIGLATSNVTETLSIAGNMSLSNYGKVILSTSNNFLGIAKSNPGYTLDVNGTANISGALNTASNITLNSIIGGIPMYINFVETGYSDRCGILCETANAGDSNRISITTSSTGSIPSTSDARLTVVQSGKVGINKLNPAYQLDVNGDVNFTGTLYQNSQLFIGSRWSSNNTGSNIYFTNGRVNIGSNTFDEIFNVTNGNAKFSSNIYINNRIGVGLSNPTDSITTAGNVRAVNGTLGPMIMLIPPFAYADVISSQRLILDNTLEAGNEGADSTWKPLFNNSGFIFSDTSTDNMQWTRGRFIFRGTSLTSNLTGDTTSMVVQDFHHNRSPQYSNITSSFTISDTCQKSGYVTCTSPWFSMSSSNVRHLAILVNSSSTTSAFRFGSVYIQFA